MSTRLRAAVLVIAICASACGADDVDEGARCTAVFDLIQDPLNPENARAAADLADGDDERRLFLWQAELAELVLDPDYEPGTLPDWEELGFDEEPTVDEMAEQLAAAAEDCAGVSST